MLHDGTRLGPYVLGQIIGRGTFAEVWEGTNTRTGSPVAVKSVPTSGMVRREVTALMALRLPGVVQLLDAFYREDRAFLVMEWVDGLPFPGRADPVRAAAQLLATLHDVHGASIVHRDLKPANVLVTAQGPVVLDLGLARGDGVGRSGATGGVSGTLRYIAPEHLLGAAPAPAADQYAVGVMLFEALAGVGPHDGGDLVANRLLGTAPVLRDVDPGIATAVGRMLAREPDQRFPHALEAARALGAPVMVAPVASLDPRSARALFSGPERVAHEPGRAAELLLSASEGDPERATETLRAWRRTGVLGPTGRVDVDRLRARTEGHHIAQDEDPAAAALALARAAGARGDPGHAARLLHLAVGACRYDPERVRSLLRAWEPHALAVWRADELERLLVEVRRAEDPALADLERVLGAALHMHRGAPERCLAELEGLDSLSACGVAVHAARLIGIEAHRRAVDAMEACARRDGHARALALAYNARATLAYEEGAYAEAAQLHQAAAAVADQPGLSLGARINAAAALLEVGLHTQVAELAARAQAEAEALGRTQHEAWAECLGRAAAYRLGRATSPDLELVDALRTLGMGRLVGYAALTEAAVAWRGGHPDTGRLANVAALAFAGGGRPGPAALASALAAEPSGDPDALDAARRASPPGVAAQALRLHAARLADAGLHDEARAAGARAGWTPDNPRRREVLAPAEVFGAICVQEET